MTLGNTVLMARVPFYHRYAFIHEAVAFSLTTTSGNRTGKGLQASAQLARRADTVSRRVCRHVVMCGYLESEGEGSYLPDGARSEDGLDAVRMHAMTYRIATGPHAGRRVTTAQTLQSDGCLALSLRTPGRYIVAINK